MTAAWKEPISGWVDNLNGPTGILVGAGKGVIRSMHCNAELNADLVPVDVAINSLIVLAHKLGTSQRKDEALVYNVTGNRVSQPQAQKRLKVQWVFSFQDNPISWGDALNIGRKHFYNNPFSVCLWYPGGSIKSSYIIHAIAAFFFHIIPAYVVDFLLTLTRNKPL